MEADDELDGINMYDDLDASLVARSSAFDEEETGGEREVFAERVLELSRVTKVRPMLPAAAADMHVRSWVGGWVGGGAGDGNAWETGGGVVGACRLCACLVD